MLNFNKKKYVSFDNLSKFSGMIQKALSDKLKNVETNLNEKIDSRFKSLTAKEQGDSEVIDARKGEASLRAKIDVIDENLKNVNSQLAHIENKLDVNVLDFGAIGDGETDDTLPIQKCIDYAIKNNVNVNFGTDKTYLVGSDYVYGKYFNSIFNFENINGLSLYGKNVVIKDNREIEKIGDRFNGVFGFTNCKNIKIELDYYHSEFAFNFDDIGYKGGTFVMLLGDNDNFYIKSLCNNARYGVKSGSFNNREKTGDLGITNSTINISSNKVGYPVAIELGDNINLRLNVYDYHRVAYLAGVSNVNVEAKGKSSYSTQGEILLKNCVYGLLEEKHKGCNSCNINFIDEGSSSPTNEICALMIDTYKLNEIPRGVPVEFSDIRTSLMLNDINNEITGFSTMPVDNQIADIYKDIEIKIIDKSSKNNKPAVRLTGFKNYNIVSNIKLKNINTNKPLYLGGENECVIDISDSTLNVININTDNGDNETFIISNCKLSILAPSQTSTRRKKIILNNSIIANKINNLSFKEAFINSNINSYGSTSDRPTDFPFSNSVQLYYDTTLNALIVKQGNYWYKLADRGSSV